MDKHFLSRRQFNALCAAVGLSSVPAGAMALSSTSVLAADAPARTAKLRNSAIVPAIGQGSARLGQGRHPETVEEEALRIGISLGMSLIDTSGNYGNGRSEKLIGRAIAANVTVYSWSPKWKPTKCLETGWRVLARPVSLASAPTFSISICCTGQCQIPNSPTS
jgi:Predicted oxidoreductases (related to aryl-alcohol dehydrogenases)